MKRKLLAIFLALVTPWSALAASAPFWAEFVDVGAGDCTIIGCDGKIMMVDTGPASAWDEVEAAMARHGAEKIDVLVLTHPHPDHVGSAAAVGSAWPVEETWVSACAYDSVETYPGNAVHKALRGDTLKLGRADIRVLWPEEGQTLVNDQSIVLRLTFGSFSLLMAADAERGAEMTMAYGAGEMPLTSTVLKVAHHGLSTSTAYPFARAVGARYAVISCDAPDKKIVPAQVTLDTLTRCGAEKIFETGRVGNVLIQVEEDGLMTIATEKTNEE